MAKGALRTAIERMIWENAAPEGGPGWWQRVKNRYHEIGQVFIAVRDRNPLGWVAWMIPADLTAVVYALFGPEWILEFWQMQAGMIQGPDPSQEIAKTLRSVFGNPIAGEISESLGALVTEPILALFEQYAGRDDLDPKEFARSFHGFMIGLNTSGALADTLLESITGGQVEGAGRFLQSIYWSLGLGFLGWQTLAPLLESGLQPGLSRYYLRLYRPARFTASDLRDLYALGEISQQTLTQEAQNLGWRNVDIDKWVRLAFNKLSEADVWQAYYQGFISQAEAVTRLRAKGYDPADIPLLFQLNPPPDEAETKDFSASNARKAFRESIITESELRDILQALKLSAREIDVIVAIEKHSQLQTARSLTVAQIRSAWEENVLTDVEARHWLGESGLDTESIDILLNTWRSEVTPVFRKINIGTITGAYVEAILTRPQALAKLKSVGLAEEDANLELNLTERRNPEAFGEPVPTKKKLLTPGTLADLVSIGLITPDQMRARLITLGYDEGDAALLAEAARVRALTPATQLPQRSIERAYQARVIERPEATSLLMDLGYNAHDAGLILDTVEVEREQWETTPVEEQVKVLTPGVLTDLVIFGLITLDEMRARLIELRYSLIDADLLVGRAELLAAPPVRILNQPTIERAYIIGVLDRGQARQKLIDLDFLPAQADQILDTVEKENPEIFAPETLQAYRQPSISALVAAVQNGLYTPDEYLARAQELGYSLLDAQMYLVLGINLEKKSTKTLTTSQVINAYGAGFLPWGVTLSRVTSQGYSNDDAILLLRIEKDRIENTDEWSTFISGDMDWVDCLTALVNARYADEDILAAFQSLPPTMITALGIDLQVLAQALKETPGGQ